MQALHLQALHLHPPLHLPAKSPTRAWTLRTQHHLPMRNRLLSPSHSHSHSHRRPFLHPTSPRRPPVFRRLCHDGRGWWGCAWRSQVREHVCTRDVETRILVCVCACARGRQHSVQRGQTGPSCREREKRRGVRAKAKAKVRAKAKGRAKVIAYLYGNSRHGETGRARESTSRTLTTQAFTH